MQLRSKIIQTPPDTDFREIPGIAIVDLDLPALGTIANARSKLDGGITEIMLPVGYVTWTEWQEDDNAVEIPGRIVRLESERMHVCPDGVYWSGMLKGTYGRWETQLFEYSELLFSNRQKACAEFIEDHKYLFEAMLEYIIEIMGILEVEKLSLLFGRAPIDRLANDPTVSELKAALDALERL